jgi:hypothetical protein
MHPETRRLAWLLAVAAVSGCGGGTQSTSASAVASVGAAPTVVTVPGRTLGTNDVSVLFPLGRGELWAATLAGRDGVALLPRSAFDLITLPLIRELQGPDATYNALRVVSLRVDPCFGGTPCFPQIRLVFQGLNASGASAFDGAVHALYNLTTDEFVTLTTRLRTVAALAPENASVTRLEVNPALLAQGMSGAYGAALRDLVVQTISGANLAKMTFMTRVQNGGDRWDFGGFNLRDFQPSGAFSISGLDGTVLVQTVRENRGGGGGGQGTYSYIVTPGILRGELNLVLSSGAAQNASAAQRQQAMDALARVENPLAESPDTVDCSACHLANRIRGNLQTSFGLSSALSYAGTAEATRVVGGADRDNDNLRAFGYFDSQPAIAQRTANETLKVVAALR